MSTRRAIFSSLVVSVVLICMAGCTDTKVEATITPTLCSGWQCTLEGVVYPGSATPGKEMSGIQVSLKQVSNCSPTAGDQQALTDENGRFSFDVYLHDTDSFVFEVSEASYQLARQKIGGFDCLYCSCSPIEIILQPEE